MPASVVAQLERDTSTGTANTLVHVLVARRVFLLSQSCRADNPLTFRLLRNLCSRFKLEDGIARFDLTAPAEFCDTTD